MFSLPYSLWLSCLAVAVLTTWCVQCASEVNYDTRMPSSPHAQHHRAPNHLRCSHWKLPHVSTQDCQGMQQCEEGKSVCLAHLAASTSVLAAQCKPRCAVWTGYLCIIYSSWLLKKMESAGGLCSVNSDIQKSRTNTSANSKDMFKMLLKAHAFLLARWERLPGVNKNQCAKPVRCSLKIRYIIKVIQN
jgi:hypothetical protein